MEFAVNYSPALAELVREGKVRLDRFKCPAWPDLLAEASRVLPVYVHFPLSVGGKLGGPKDEETHKLADLGRVEELLLSTGTPLINTHLNMPARSYPEIPADTRDPRYFDRAVAAVMRDLEPLILRFGPERVTVENIINAWGCMTTAVMPELIRKVLDESGCGFLFDLSHARLAAANLGMDPRTYISELPVERIREIHVTGIQKLEGALLDDLLAAGDPGGEGAAMGGKAMDHLPMTEADWIELEWMVGEIRAGRWDRAGVECQPWVTAFEFGGVSGFWEMVSKREVYLEQLPRMADLLEAHV